MSSIIYLASPYTHRNPRVVDYRFRAVCKKSAELMLRGLHVYSPIAHTHPIAMQGSLPTTWEYWESFDRAMIAACGKLLVLRIRGWKESKGVQAEIAIAHELDIPVDFIDP